IAHGRSLVPAFREARRPRDHPRKAGFGLDELSALHGLDAFLQEFIHLGDSRPAPHRPERGLRPGGRYGIISLKQGERLLLGHRSPLCYTSAPFPAACSRTAGRRKDLTM